MSEFRRRLLMQQGELPYQQIEFLESSGEQMIITDYCPNPNTEIYCSCQIGQHLKTGGYSVFLGAYEEGTEIITFYINSYNNARNSFFVVNNIQSIYRTLTVPTEKTTTKTTLIITPSQCQMFDTTINIREKTTTNTIPLGLFGCNRIPKSPKAYEMFSFRIYSCKIYEDSVLVRDYIPVRVGNVGYMYDKVSKQLFGNIGTGQFILGQDV